MTWHPFTLTAVTPLFLGAADIQPRAVDELASGQPDPHDQVPFPVPSLRGVLRYWLRALIGAHVGNDLVALRQVERRVFGAAAVEGDTSRGRSPVALRATSRISVEPRTAGQGRRPYSWVPDWVQADHGAENGFSGCAYLLGQGLFQAGKDGTLRGHIPVGESVGLSVGLTDPAGHVADLFLASLWAMQAFGGLGARARRAMGTVAVTPPEGLTGAEFDTAWLTRDNINDLDEVLRCAAAAVRALGADSRPHDDEVPDYPCFMGGHFHVYEWPLVSDAAWDDALHAVGEQWRRFRVYRDPWGSGRLRAHTPEYDALIDPFLRDAPITGPGTFNAGAYGLPVGYRDMHGLRDAKGNPTSRAAKVIPLLDGEEIRRPSPIWLRSKPGERAREWHLRSLAFLCEWLPEQATLQIEEIKKNGPSRRDSLVKPTQPEAEAALRMWFHMNQRRRQA